MKSNMKVFGDVVPYYFTWLLLSMFRVDRTNSYNVLIGLIAVVCVFEMQARFKYGTEGSYDSLFSSMYSFYPENFTIGESMKLTR